MYSIVSVTPGLSGILLVMTTHRVGTAGVRGSSAISEHIQCVDHRGLRLHGRRKRQCSTDVGTIIEPLSALSGAFFVLRRTDELQ